MKTADAVILFLNSRKAQGISPEAASWYKGILGRFTQMFTELPADPESPEAFLAAQTCSDESLYSYWKTLKAFYNWCAKRQSVPNPMTQVGAPRRRKKHPRTLSAAELASLFLVRLSKRDRALLCLLIDTGIRIGEAISLKAGDIQEETIIVEGKTGAREVPLTQDTRHQLLALATSGYVFRGYRGHLSRPQAYNIVHGALKASGLTGRKLGPHLLRHTLGRQFIMAGGDLVSLQRILGHSSIQTTRIYAELSMADVIRQHHKFTPIRAALAPTQGRLIAEAESIIRTMSREEDQR